VVALPFTVEVATVLINLASVLVSNTIRSPAELTTERASATLFVRVNTLIPVAPSKVMVLPVKLSENVDAHLIALEPKLSVESVSEIISAPEVIPAVVVTRPVRVDVVSTVSVPAVLIFVLIVVAALTKPVTKRTDKITEDATETGPRLINLRSISFVFIIYI